MTAQQDLVLVRFDERGEQGRIAWVMFNNPEKRNALGIAGKERFIEVMTELKHDESLRAVVLSGSGEHDLSGEAHIKRIGVLTGSGDKSFVGCTNIAEMAEFDLAMAEASATKTHRVCDAVRTFPVPVIARINGYCFGSGMEIAACADMRVAADHAKFGMPEVRFGIPSGMEASALPRLIGWGKACELVLTGDHIDAEEAYRIGYLQRLVAYDRLDIEVEGWLDSLLACGPRAVRIQKRLIIDWDRMSVTDGARAGIQAYVDAYRSDEPRRMMLAFVNRKRR